MFLNRTCTEKEDGNHHKLKKAKNLVLPVVDQNFEI